MTIAGRRLSWLDTGGPGRPLLALHGHFAAGHTFAGLAPGRRLIAPDQRGHGESDPAPDYSRDGYVADAVALLDHLGLRRVAVLGHSLGGVTAYQLAARHPDRVSALVVEDIGAVVHGDLSFALQWPARAATRPALLAALGRSAPYLAGSMREDPDGWTLTFRPADMVASQQALNGDHWTDWLASTCPALLIRGARSDRLTRGHALEMLARRPRTELVELPAGHTVHETVPTEYAAAVAGFLTRADA